MSKILDTIRAVLSEKTYAKGRDPVKAAANVAKHIHSIPAQRTDTTAYGGSMTESFSSNKSHGYYGQAFNAAHEALNDEEAAHEHAAGKFFDTHRSVMHHTGASHTEAKHYLDSVHGRHLHGQESPNYIKKDFAKFKKTYKPEHFTNEGVILEVSAGAMSRAKERQEKQQADYHASMHRQHTELAAAHRLSDDKAHKFHKDSAAAHSAAHKKLTGLALESVELTEHSHFIGTTRDKSGHKHTVWQHGQYSYGIHNNVTDEHHHIHQSLDHVKQHLKNMGHTSVHPSGFLGTDGGSDQIGGGLNGPLMGEETLGEHSPGHSIHHTLATQKHRLIKQYRHNENENEHDKNALLMAKHFGTPEEYRTTHSIVHNGYSHLTAPHAREHMSKMHGYFIKHLWPHDPTNPNRHPQPVHEAYVDTGRYVRAHGKSPRGSGSWIFSAHREGVDFQKHKEGHDWMQTPGNTSYGNAVKHAKAWAKEKGHHTVHVAESVQIDELSKNTLAGYAAKAADKGMQHAYSAGGTGETNPKHSYREVSKAVKRLKGVKQAIKKLSEGSQIDEVKSGEIKNHPHVGRRVKWTQDGQAHEGTIAHVHREHTFSQMHPWKTEYHVRKDDNSYHIIRKDHPTTKLMKEDLAPNATASDYIHDFVHSDNKVFKGDSVKQRIKRALGAWYAKHKGK